MANWSCVHHWWKVNIVSIGPSAGQLRYMWPDYELICHRLIVQFLSIMVRYTTETRPIWMLCDETCGSGLKSLISLFN